MPHPPNIVRTGLDVLVEKDLALLRGKTVGIVTNHTARTREGRHIVDVLHAASGVHVAALFGPEHGIRGDVPDGTEILSQREPKTEIPIWSLYGETRKPTPEMLQGIDTLLYDIQDVGARFYTFISTLFLCAEAAFEQGIEIVVLDRPNPITGTKIEGPLLDRKFASFVGIYSLPIRHGMTVGELARLFTDEGNGLTVVPMEGWQRAMWFDQTGLTWIPPSPNMPSLSSATVYPGTCLVEGTNVSEGRGSPRPFQYIGAPWLNGNRLSQALNASDLPGVRFEPISFTPVAIPAVASRPKYRNQTCGGVCLDVTHRDEFDAVRTGLHLLSAIHRLHPRDFSWRADCFDKLSGTDQIRLAIVEGRDLDEIIQSGQGDLERFEKMRRKVLLYP